MKIKNKSQGGLCEIVGLDEYQVKPYFDIDGKNWKLSFSGNNSTNLYEKDEFQFDNLQNLYDVFLKDISLV